MILAMTEGTITIGGEFEFSPKALPIASDPDDFFLSQLSNEKILCLNSARAALFLLARLFSSQGRRVWLPAYCCESIVSAFRAGGCPVRFYPLGEEGVRGKGTIFPSIASGDVFLFIHYFGRRNDSALEMARRLKKKGVIVLEDCVQASLDVALGTVGDFVIRSFRKFLPLPSGATLRLPAAGQRDDLVSHLETTACAREDGAIAARILKALNAPETCFVPILQKAEREIDYLSPRFMSRFVRLLLPHADRKKIVEKRRNNWKYMKGILEESPLHSKKIIRPLFSNPGKEEAPLGYPVVLKEEQRDHARSKLAEKRIFCPVHWPLPFLPREACFRKDHELSRRILTLPIDQRLTEKELRLTIAELERVLL